MQGYLCYRERGTNYKVAPLKYLYHDRTLHENCREIENRQTNLKSPSADGDLGVDEKASAPARLCRVGMLRKMVLDV